VISRRAIAKDIRPDTETDMRVEARTAPCSGDIRSVIRIAMACGFLALVRGEHGTPILTTGGGATAGHSNWAWTGDTATGWIREMKITGKTGTPISRAIVNTGTRITVITRVMVISAITRQDIGRDSKGATGNRIGATAMAAGL
jgi:hypothetical protein